MEEITLNIHTHSTFSDGTGTFHEIAQAALSAGLDAVIMTDHNLLLKGKDAYFYRDGKRTLLLVAEEINDMQGTPGNHLIVINYPKELSHLSAKMQMVINEANRGNAITIVAHPYERDHKREILRPYSWDQWNVHGFTGLEIYNHLSEFKNRAENTFSLLANLFSPDRFLIGAAPKALEKWDELLNSGHRVFAFCGADAHQLKIQVGPFKKTVFPYLTHFNAVQTHAYIPDPLNGDLEHDSGLIYGALKQGRFHIGLDGLESSRGFEFKADYEGGTALSGDQLMLSQSATIKINTPGIAIVNLIRNGEIIGTWDNRASIAQTITSPGVYRVECRLPVRGKLRGWIYSNPIFVYRGKNDR